MNLWIAASREKAAALTAHILGRILMTPGARMGLATGETMVPVYQELGNRIPTGRDLGSVSTFNLDEYWRVPPWHPGSFRHFMQTRLFAHIPLDPRNIHFLRGDAEDPEAECQRYENLLAVKPLTVQLLGIGVNGHIGFNEPGTAFSSRTRKVKLSPETRRQNRPHFTGAMPEEALTMGIGNILSADALVLVATGAHKRRILCQALTGPVTVGCPASALQIHPEVTVIADQAAAADLLAHPDVLRAMSAGGSLPTSGDGILKLSYWPRKQGKKAPGLRR